MPHFPSPAESPGIVDVVTEEAAVQTPTGEKLPVTPLVGEGEMVAKGAPVVCLRQTPSICLVAPVAGHPPPSCRQEFAPSSHGPSRGWTGR